MITGPVLGIGNALTDMLVEVNDEQLKKFSLPKGSMQLVNAERARQLQAELQDRLGQKCAGGCAANTISGLGEFGIKTAFIGKVGKDPIGDFFDADLQSHGVESRLLRSDTRSGTALTLVTPDGERTFATHLGAAIELTDKELTTEMFSGAQLFHIEGYLVQNHDLIAGAVKMAKEAGMAVSIDLAAYNVVEQNLEFLHGLLDYGLDIIFANEEEAMAFTGAKNEQQALDQLASQCQVAVVKLGKKGALLASGEQRRSIKVKAVKPLDTTGAGDLFAAGFLFGLLTNRNLETCGEFGAMVAKEIIQVMGTKLPQETWDRLRAQMQ